jgi:hypothetical protein
MKPLTQSKNTTILPVLIALTLVCFALSPQARAVIPAPDGGYPNENTAEGTDALFSLNTGSGFGNTAVGFDALFSTVSGVANTAVGVQALQANTDGPNNVAVGFGALERNTTGQSNTAVGTNALAANTSGSVNTAVGIAALSGNSTGFQNTAVGANALETNSIGLYNTALGDNALVSSDTGNSNTATGQGALENNSSGSNNTADGAFALGNNDTGSNNIALGASAGSNITAGSNNIDIGHTGISGESNTIRIGTGGTQTETFIAGIRGTTVTGGIAVFVKTNGKLGTNTSSRRFKDGIKPMDKASEAILALEPVTFHYKKELDPEGVPQFGLVAEDVEKVNPDLVARDEQGKPYTVRYDAVNMMLLNEFLKEHRKNEQQEATVAELKSTVAQQQKQIDALTAGLRKVSAQLEVSKAAPQTVLNSQ